MMVKLSHKFFRSKINSKKRLTYNEVENIIDNKISHSNYETEIIDVIKSLYDVYSALEK